MSIKNLAYVLTAAGLLGSATFKAVAQQGAGVGRGAILSQEDRTAVREATRSEMTKLRADLQAAQKAAVEAALAENAKDEDVKAKLDAVSKIQTEIALVNCKAIKKTVKFTAEQLNRMKEAPGLGYSTLFGGAGAAGRPGGARGGGGASQQ